MSAKLKADHTPTCWFPPVGGAMNLRHLFAATAIALITYGGAATAQETEPNGDATKANAGSGASLYSLGSRWTTQDGASVWLGS